MPRAEASGLRLETSLGQPPARAGLLYRAAKAAAVIPEEPEGSSCRSVSLKSVVLSDVTWKGVSKRGLLGPTPRIAAEARKFALPTRSQVALMLLWSLEENRCKGKGGRKSSRFHRAPPMCWHQARGEGLEAEPELPPPPRPP